MSKRRLLVLTFSLATLSSVLPANAQVPDSNRFWWVADLNVAVLSDDQVMMPLWNVGAGLQYGSRAYEGIHGIAAFRLLPLPAGQGDQEEMEGGYRYVSPVEGIDGIWPRAELGLNPLINGAPWSGSMFFGNIGCKSFHPWAGAALGVRLGSRVQMRLEVGADRGKYRETTVRFSDPPQGPSEVQDSPIYSAWKKVTRLGFSFRGAF